ncbi:hypothetical protein STEG23_008471 [Scotinomys teguina]
MDCGGPLRLGTCHRVGVPAESPGEAKCGSEAHLQQKISEFWRCQYEGMTTKTVAAVEWNQPEPRRQAVCAADGRARDVTEALWSSPNDVSPSNSVCFSNTKDKMRKKEEEKNLEYEYERRTDSKTAVSSSPYQHGGQLEKYENLSTGNLEV